MFEGDLAERAVWDLYEFDILQLLYKIPSEAVELADQSLVKELIKSSAMMC